MPELPEVETVVRGLHKALVGRQIDHVAVHRPRLRLPIPEDLGTRLCGRTITAVTRRAKYGAIHLDDGTALLFHLGMTGNWIFRPLETPPAKHDHIVITMAPEAIAFHDPRRFGLVVLGTSDTLLTHPLLRDLGPEPFDPCITPLWLQRRLSGKKIAIKPALLDQTLIVGVGNIYASEALFQARIHPDTPAGAVSAVACGRLIEAVQAVLHRAIAAGGSTLRDYVQTDGNLGYFQHEFAVYDRADQPCVVCGTPICHSIHAQRSTYYCQQCQPSRVTKTGARRGP
jgi:formamidopyrimidine-DNA glycosylase